MNPLPVLHDGVRTADLDIVSIPGLPTINPRYKLKDHNQWLREVLSHRVPQARIMAFQYDFGQESQEVAWMQLIQHAEGLLYSLIHRREGVESRPIIFALLLAKNTPAFRSILDMTGGIVFLGCLNNETRPNFEDLCLKCAAVEMGVHKKDRAIESLRQDNRWTFVKEVMEDFRALNGPFPVRILFELNPSNIGSRQFVVRTMKQECLCSEEVSRLGWASEQLVPVQKNHTELTMYPQRSDDDAYFQLFIKTLSEMIEEVVPKTVMLPKSLNGSNDSKSVLSIDLSSDDDVVSILTAPRPDLNFSGGPNIPCFVTWPYDENTNFIGRENELERIHTKLCPIDGKRAEQRIFALTGLGGMGKTQTAVKYAFKYRNVYQIVLLAHADGQSKLAESFSSFADKLGLGAGMSAIKAKQAVKDLLGSIDVPWLLIFDNADTDDNVQLLEEFWPCKSQGSILITSRDHTLVRRFTGMELVEMSEPNAVDLLLRLVQFDRSLLDDADAVEEEIAAKKIVKQLGFLPLGIGQAATLIINDSCSLAAFLEDYTLRELVEDSSDIHLESQRNGYKYSLKTVWDMNFESLTKDQKSLMKVMSFLDPDRIQLRVLKDGLVRPQAPEFDFISSPYKLSKCRAGLLRSTLVSQSQNGRELRMHRLVQAYCQLTMDIEESRKNFQSAINLIKAVWPVPNREMVHNPALWEEQRGLLNHVQKLCEFYVKSCENGEPLIPHTEVNWDFASVLYEAGWFCYESGLLESVSELLVPAKEYCIKHLSKGGGYRILADIYGGLGSLATESNQFQRAYDDFNEEWECVKLAFDANELSRPSIWEVFGLGRVGNGLQGLHRYAEAEEYYRMALKAWEGLPGDRKVWVSNMCTCLWLQGKLDEGEKTIKAVIKDENDATNFRTGLAMNCLGNIQISQAERLKQEGKTEEGEARLAEAMATHTKVLRLFTIALGKRHHKTADIMYKVGWHLHQRQEYQKSLEMLKNALDVYTSQPEIFKNEIARTKYKLGCLKQDMGAHVEGADLIREAERIRQEIVAPEDWEPAQGEKAFDEIVQFWTR
ncbi:unnamed protein product [Clonostachys rosea]|uniref:DUF7779 domain-containing protein n=1 Tax=Bionectria ochroleuca TaxID=29856 RepID=A0ABY6UI78_BIOOC|nr:unnamed protein product [Clonostachys rosea]